MLYREVLASAPDEYAAVKGAGTCLLLLGRPAEAKSHYLHALEQRQDDAELLNNLAEVSLQLHADLHQARGWAQEAVALYRQAHTQARSHAERELASWQLALTLGTLGSACLADQDPRHAESCFAESLQLVGERDQDVRARRLEQIARCRASPSLFPGGR